jgi:HTH-type transcriptional regulator/antitoxin HipB
MLAITERDFGNIVRERRLELGLTQAQLAKRIGMSRQWVVGFEGGRAATATIAHLVRVAEELRLDIDVTAAP